MVPPLFWSAESPPGAHFLIEMLLKCFSWVCLSLVARFFQKSHFYAILKISVILVILEKVDFCDTPPHGFFFQIDAYGFQPPKPDTP